MLSMFVFGHEVTVERRFFHSLKKEMSAEDTQDLICVVANFEPRV